MHLEKRGEGTQISQDPPKLSQRSRDSKAQKNKGEGPREAGSLTKQRLSQRSLDRKAEAHKGWGGTQRSREPKRTKCCPREAGTVKHTIRGEGPRKAGSLTKQWLSQRSLDRKAEAHKGWGGTQRSREPKRTKCCPREAGTVKHTVKGEGPRKAGSLPKQRLSQRSLDRKAEAHKGWGGTQRSREPKRTKCCPREAGTVKHTIWGEGPRKAGSLTKQRLSQRSLDRKAEAHKGWGGTQRSRDPNRTEAPKGAGRQQQQVLLRCIQRVISRPRCQAVHQNHPNHASREKSGRGPDKPGPAKNCPREAGRLKHKRTQ